LGTISRLSSCKRLFLYVKPVLSFTTVLLLLLPSPAAR
jgi:hypothetical protein